MPGEHCKKTAGKHRKPGRTLPLSLTWRTTGGLIAGAAVLGTAVATAQASLLPSGSPGAASAAAGLTGGEDVGNARTVASQGRAAPSPSAEPRSEQKPRPTAAQAIKLARSQVGIEENGGGETKFQKWYMSTSRAQETLQRDGGSLSGYGDANWCDMFVSWVGEQIGFSGQIGSDAWTVAHARWFQSRGRWGTEPKPGAIVFYAWDGRKASGAIKHVGMVVKKVDGDTIEAVEGNTGNAVRVKKRSADDIVGYGYPDYR